MPSDAPPPPPGGPDPFRAVRADLRAVLDRSVRLLGDHRRLLDPRPPVYDPILVVDDSPRDLELAERALAGAGLPNPVLTARSGPEAAALIAHLGTPPAVVFLDLDLKDPGADGLDLLAAVQADPGTRAVPVVVLAGTRSPAAVGAAYAAGANAYLPKPADFRALAAAVRAAARLYAARNVRPPA